MIGYDLAIRIHEVSIRDYGGGSGLRDEFGLLAAPGRP